MSKSKGERRKSSRKLIFFDYSLLAELLFLVCFGLVMLYSSSAYSALVTYGDSMYYFKRQLLFCVLGLIWMFIVSRIDYHLYMKWSKALYFVSIAAMFLVKTPLGKEVNGARRWIRLPGGQQLQPAEIAKIAIILFIPALICPCMGRNGCGLCSPADGEPEYGGDCCGNYLCDDFCGASGDKTVSGAGWQRPCSIYCDGSGFEFIFVYQ